MTASIQSSPDEQLNFLLLSNDLANVRLGLQLALNPYLPITDLSALIGLSILDRHPDISETATDIVRERLGASYHETLKKHWQPTHKDGSEEVLFRSLRALERVFNMEKGRLMTMAVQKLGRFPERIAHRYPLAFKQWCEDHLEADGNLNLVGRRIPHLPKILFTIPGIKSLQFANAGFKVIPPEVGKLNQVRFLDFASIDVSDLPSTMKQLHTLEELRISGYNLRSMPKVLPQIPNLKTLIVFGARDNFLIGIDSLPKLDHLEMTIFAFAEIPDSLGNITRLKKLYIDSRHPIPDLPDSINNLVNLETLMYKAQYVRFFPQHLNGLKRLKRLILGGMLEECELPDISELTQLRELELEYDIYTPIPYPKQCCGLPNLTKLTVTGAIQSLPEEFKQLQNLVDITITKSALEGLPEALCHLPKLQYLEIDGAHFQPELLPSAGIPKLETIILDNCGLTTVPEFIFKCKNLQNISLANNHIPLPQANDLRAAFPNAGIYMK